MLAGVNSRFDEMQAAVLRVKLPQLAEDNRRRQAIAERYRQLLAGASLEVPPAAGVDHVHHLFVVRMGERTQVRAVVADAGVGTAVHYPVPPHRQGAYRDLEPAPLPVTERLADSVLSLPMHPALTDAQVERVAEVLCAVE